VGLDPTLPIVVPHLQHTRDVLLMVSAVWVAASLLHDRSRSREAIKAPVLSAFN
jgi:hypothetical protein